MITYTWNRVYYLKLDVNYKKCNIESESGNDDDNDSIRMIYR